MLRTLSSITFGAVIAGGAFAAGSLENPQPSAIESGIGVVSGWNCQATTITIQVDNGPQIVAPYGSDRADTATVCGGRTKTGFSYLLNYNTLSTGSHTINAYADGVMFGTATFNAVSLGSEFLSGKVGEYWLNNFPAYGTRTRVTWQPSKQNFIVSGSDNQVASIDGTYYGALTTTNSGCTAASNNGAHLEVDRFTVSFNAQSLLTMVADNLIASASCTYSGSAFYSTSGGEILVPAGTFACNNGLQGTWAADRMLFDPVGMLANITSKYTALETCSTVTHIGAAR